MKNVPYFLLLILFLISIYPSIAQDLPQPDQQVNVKKWVPAKFGVRIGGYEDHYQNLTLQGLQSMIGNQATLSDFLEDGYGDEYFTALTGSNIGLQFSLNPFSRKRGTHNLNHELRLGLSMNTDRESMLVFQRDASDPLYGYDYQEELIYCLIENEVLVEASYLFRKPLGRSFSVYGGFGANFGSTYGNEVLVIAPFSEEPVEDTPTYQALNSNYLRVLMQAGMEVTIFQKLGLYLEFQGGDGVQIVHGGENNTMENCATFFGVNWDLGK